MQQCGPVPLRHTEASQVLENDLKPIISCPDARVWQTSTTFRSHKPHGKESLPVRFAGRSDFARRICVAG